MGTTQSVLVTGATGFIGREVVTALAEAGWQVIRGQRKVDDLQPDGEVHIDLAQPATLLALAKGARFDAIVHLGAHVGLANETESDLFVPNVLATGCLAYLAHLWGARLIFASSAIVHGARAEDINEGSPICADTPYAKSKWLAEQLLDASGVKHCTLRIAGVFGADGPSHLGLNRAIQAARNGELPQQIGSGLAQRNYIYVKDVAGAIVYALQDDLEGTHLLAGHEVISVKEMLQVICDTFAPGRHPLVTAGAEATNQVVRPSSSLPAGRGFGEALADIEKTGR